MAKITNLNSYLCLVDRIIEIECQKELKKSEKNGLKTKYRTDYNDSTSVPLYDDFDFWSLTPLSAIFQLYYGDELRLVILAMFVFKDDFFMLSVHLSSI
jgi:hypothetical protein